MSVAFTYVSAIIFIFYIVTNNNLIGMISFNCATAVLFGFKSAVIIDPYGYKKCIDLMGTHHSVSYNKILIGDFFAHTAPVLYLIYTYNDWVNINYLTYAFIISISIHFGWAFTNCNGLNLNKIYLSNSEYQMGDKNWQKLWLFSFFGHSLSSVVYILSKEFT